MTTSSKGHKPEEKHLQRKGERMGMHFHALKTPSVPELKTTVFMSACKGISKNRTYRAAKSEVGVTGQALLGGWNSAGFTSV